MGEWRGTGYDECYTCGHYTDCDDEHNCQRCHADDARDSMTNLGANFIAIGLSHAVTLFRAKWVHGEYHLSRDQEEAREYVARCAGIALDDAEGEGIRLNPRS